MTEPVSQLCAEIPILCGQYLKEQEARSCCALEMIKKEGTWKTKEAVLGFMQVKFL